MKKLILSTLMVGVAMLLTPNTSHAQENSGESVFTLQAGFSVTGGIIKAVNNVDAWSPSDTASGAFGGTTSADVIGGPAIGVGFDFGLSRRWSIGVLASTQGWAGELGYSYFDDNDNLVDENISMSLRRSSVNLTPKIHYGNGDNIDLYSGVRLGYLFWNGSVESSDPDFDEVDVNFVSRPTFSLIAFGGRFYMTDNIAVNFELAMGSPYLFGIGANYKL